LAALGYGPELVGSLVGNEFNFREGHGGVYPVPYDPTDAAGGGAMPYQTPNPDGSCPEPMLGINCYHDVVAFPLMHARMPGVSVVTVNHPFWCDTTLPGCDHCQLGYQCGDLGYFTNIGWGASTPHPPPTPLGSAGLFDAMEVLNGYQTNAVALGALVQDWFYLLSTGVRVTALGNSDTHKINWLRSGWPRSWLRLPNDRPGDTMGTVFADAVRQGRAVASTGPFVAFTVDGAQIGDTVVPKTAGQVTIDITADVPGWMRIDTVRLYVNGQEATHWSVAGGTHPAFHATVTQPITGDSWIVVNASGAQPLPADIVGEVSYASGSPMLPWAITNPVFVDADGSGSWKPPMRPIPRRPGEPAFDPIDGRAFQKAVPAGCDPSEAARWQEPPLDGPALLMPLLSP
jgi:hypothetical protein